MRVYDDNKKGKREKDKIIVKEKNMGDEKIK